MTVQSNLYVAKSICCVRLSLETKGGSMFSRTQNRLYDKCICAGEVTWHRSLHVLKIGWTKTANAWEGLSLFVHQHISSFLIPLLPSFLMLAIVRRQGLYSDCAEGCKTEGTWLDSTQDKIFVSKIVKNDLEFYLPFYLMDNGKRWNRQAILRTDLSMFFT